MDPANENDKKSFITFMRMSEYKGCVLPVKAPTFETSIIVNQAKF